MVQASEMSSVRPEQSNEIKNLRQTIQKNRTDVVCVELVNTNEVATVAVRRPYLEICPATGVFRV